MEHRISIVAPGKVTPEKKTMRTPYGFTLPALSVAAFEFSVSRP